MMQKRAALTAALILCSALAAAEDATKGKTTVEVSSLAVSRKLGTKDFPFSSNSTSLSLWVSCPGKQVLGVDPSSAIKEFKDDKGHSLLTAGFFKTQFSAMPSNISPDRNSLIVTVYSAACPTKGASKILLKGELVLKCGSEEKTTEEKELELKKDAEVKTGDYTIKVTQEKGFGGAGASFSVTAPAPIIKSVTVKDADGKTVEVSNFGAYGFAKTWTFNFGLKREIKKGKFSVTYFSKEEKATVAVDLATGVGL